MLDSLPILTSDLLLEDINKFVCQKKEDNKTADLLEGCESKQEEAKPVTKSRITSYQSILDQLCGNDLEKKIKRHTDQLEELNETKSKLAREFMKYRKEYLKISNPYLHNRVMGYYREQNRLFKMMAFAEDSEKLEPLIQYSLKQARQDKGLEDYHFALLRNISFNASPEFKTYVNSQTSVNDLQQTHSRIGESIESHLHKRKELQDQLRRKRKELATQLFDLPLFHEAKEIYEQVRKCETTPLD